MTVAPQMTMFLDRAKPGIAEAVATIAPAAPPAMIDAISEHLTLFPAEARQLAAVRLR